MNRIIAATLALFFVIPFLRANDGWDITTTDRSDNYWGATAANGQIGMLVWREPFRIPHVMVNRLDDQTGPEGISQMVRGVNPFGLTLSIDDIPCQWDNITQWQQTMEMQQGAISTSFVTADSKAQVTYTVRALRHLPNCGMIEVAVKALKGCNITATDSLEVPDCYVDAKRHAMSYRTKARKVNVAGVTALTQYRKRLVAASAAFIVPDPQGVHESGNTNGISLSRKMKKGETFRFALVGTITTDRQCLDPLSEADRQTVFAVAQGIDRLAARHLAEWDKLWQGDIVIEGDNDAQQLARFCLYNLYSFCRQGSRSSIPPFGLSLQQFNGHIFWDSEMWMMPPMTLLAPDIARSMIDLSYKPHQRPPFGCITEGAYDATVYFATGAGGFLQCIINGFCGLELTDNGVVQLPSVLPPAWKRLEVRGVGPDRKTFVRTNSPKSPSHIHKTLDYS